MNSDNNMKPLECPWRFIGRIFLIVLSIFVVLLFGALYFEHVLGRDVHRTAVYLNFAIQGGVWLVLVAVFLGLARRNSSRLTRLREEGICYGGEVLRVDLIPGVNVANYLVNRADCSYVNEMGQKCLVRSKAFMTRRLTPPELIAKIYVNRYDPKDYAVEMFESGLPNIEADYDYR